MADDPDARHLFAATSVARSDGGRWYVPAWLDVPGLPTFEVVDTRSAQGRLDPRPKHVTVADLVLFHGHACDGLVRGVWAMRALADLAFGAAPLDRSDLLVVAKGSPCLGDVAAYLTGGRARYGTLRFDDTLGVGFRLQVRSTGECFDVREEPGFFPERIAAWETALLGDLDETAKRELLAVHETAQWDWVRQVLLPSAPSDHYRARRLEHLDLPPALAEARRTDTVNRSVDPPSEATSPYEPALDASGSVTSDEGPWARRYEAGPG
ncbi:MAG: formylmethanofuran dehydrogenase subunit E family protein [Actinomycetota bacterium]|jgi:formylmethanofuran dehydrogenase subunit E|nr:formylmethanofuran dehydrogenase subunit E family protein [Actinomycetota bacterium]